MVPSSIQLGYWAIRGLGQPIRLLLEDAGADYVEKRYEQGPPPELDKSCWLDEKETLGLAFPNLPYLIDGNRRLTQTRVILEYLAAKLGYLGSEKDEILNAGMLWEACSDMRKPYLAAAYSANFEERRDVLVSKTLPWHIEKFADFLGENDWMAGGSEATWVDFALYDLLDQFKSLDTGLLSPHGNLLALLARVEARPNINAYLARRGGDLSFIDHPFNNRRAVFT